MASRRSQINRGPSWVSMPSSQRCNVGPTYAYLISSRTSASWRCARASKRTIRPCCWSADWDEGSFLRPGIARNHHCADATSGTELALDLSPFGTGGAHHVLQHAIDDVLLK